MNGLILALAVVSADVQIMEASKLRSIRASLPVLADEEWNERLHSPRMQLYTEAEMPPAYQRVANATISGHGSSTFHNPYYNVSGDFDERSSGGHGNPNREFPWNLKPGGAHVATDVTSVKGMLLPPGKPVVYWRDDVPVKPHTVVPHGRIAVTRMADWMFPDGTVFTEIIYQQMPDYDYAFEVRFRMKNGDSWDVEVFRPFATSDELADAIEEMGPGKYRQEAIASLRAEERQQTMRLVDRHHPDKHAFDETEYLSQLPTIATADVQQLINRPFQSTLGEMWKQDAIAPTNDTGKFNIVPPGYFASHVGNSAQHCVACHDSAGDHNSEFDARRGWYGRVRGSRSDKIFTWHMVAPEGISNHGGPVPAYIRKSFIDAGIVERYDPQKHSDYQRTK